MGRRVLGSAVAIMAGCVGDSAVLRDGGADVTIPDASVDAPDGATPLCDVSKPFGAPTLMTEFDTSGEDRVFRLSTGYLTGWFGSTRDGGLGGGDIYTANRTNLVVPWMGVTLVSSVDTAYDEDAPTITADGLSLFFESDRPGSALRDIYVATRTNPMAMFDPPALVGNVNSPGADIQPYIRPDGEVLYFASTLTAAGTSFSVMRAASSGAGFSAPTPVSELNAVGESAPVVTPDDLVIYWSSLRTDGGALGSFDIWVATRASVSDPFGGARNVGELNSVMSDAATYITADRCTVYLTRQPAAGSGGALYVASKTP